MKKWSPRMRRRFLEEVERCGTITGAAAAVGVIRDTVQRWLRDKEGFREDVEAARDVFVGKMGEKAQRILDAQLTKMEEGEEPFDLPTVKATLSRNDVKWTQRYQRQDVTVSGSVSLKSVIDELDAATKEMEDK